MVSNIYTDLLLSHVSLLSNSADLCLTIQHSLASFLLLSYSTLTLVVMIL